MTAAQPDVRSNYYNADADDEYEAYDRFGRVSYTDWRRYSGTVTSLDQYDYTYDRVGNRKTRDLDSTAVSGAPTTRDHLYTYDQLYRLKNFDEGQLVGGAINGTPGREQDYTLQQLGNWSGLVVKASGATTLSQSRLHNDANEIDNNNNHADAPVNTITASVGTNWADPVQDAAGNMTSVPKPSSLSAAYTLTYDAWNRLVKVQDGAATVATFEYDALGRRTKKVAGSVTYDYYYNEAWQVVEVRKNADTDPLEQFAWHAYYIDAPLVRFYDSDVDGAGIVEHYYGHDAQFNVTVVHDVSANVVERYTYTPYGELTIMNASWTTLGASAIGNAYTYTGREYDSETGLYNFRNRYFHAQLGRFVERDPIGYWDGMNLYQGYFVPDASDPDGLVQIYVNKGADYVDGNVQRGTWMHVHDDDGIFVRSFFIPLRDGDTLGHQQEIDRMRQYILANGYAQGVADQVATNIEVAATLAAFGLPGPEDLVICIAAKIGYKVFVRGGELVIEKAGQVLRGRQRQKALDDIKDAMQCKFKAAPGPHAKESIPARGPGRDFRPDERDKINRIGCKYGCHTCGTKNPGTKTGNFIPDHQPPSSIANGQPQVLYPHCLDCSRDQGLKIGSLGK